METTTQNRPTIAATAIRYGVFTGIVAILYAFVLIISRQQGNAALGWLSMIIPIGGISLAMLDFRKRNGGYMTYGEGLGIGTLLSLVSGVLSTVFNFVYRVVDPSVVEQAMEQARVKLEEGGRLTDEQIDQAIAMSQKFTTGPVGFAIGIIGSVFIGALLSLLLAAIFKNSKPEFE